MMLHNEHTNTNGTMEASTTTAKTSGGMVRVPSSINIHENYVDWNHNKREQMLKDLLNELDIKIQISREKLELASIEKKNQLDLLVSHFQEIILPRLDIEENKLEAIKQKELKQRNELETNTDVTNNLKASLKQLLSPSSTTRKKTNSNNTNNNASSTKYNIAFISSSSNNHNNVNNNNNIPIITGTLYKRSDHLELWRKRWFELTTNKLNYFYNEIASVKRNAKPRGFIKVEDIIECSLIHPNINIHNPNPLRNTDTPLKMKKSNLPQILVIRAETQTYILASPTYRESFKWVNIINNLMEKCRSSNIVTTTNNNNNINNDDHDDDDDKYGFMNASMEDDAIYTNTNHEELEDNVDTIEDEDRRNSSFDSNNMEITRETLDADFKICANNLEIAKSKLEDSIQTMLKIIEERETSVQIIQSIHTAVECIEISIKAFPNSLKENCEKSINDLKHRIKKQQKKNNIKKKQRIVPSSSWLNDNNNNNNGKPGGQIFKLNDLLSHAMEHYDKYIQKALSINVEQHVSEVSKLYLFLKDLHEADTNKRYQWERLEEYVVQRARAEVRYRDLIAHVKEFHVIKSPVRTSFIAKNMMDSFNKQGLLSPLPNKRRYSSNGTDTRRNRNNSNRGGGNQTIDHRMSNNNDDDDDDDDVSVDNYNNNNNKNQTNNNNYLLLWKKKKRNDNTGGTTKNDINDEDDGFFDIAL